MNLIADIGNSFTKLAVFNDNFIIEKRVFENENDKNIQEKIALIKLKYPGLERVILSTVKNTDEELQKLIKKLFRNYIFFNDKTPVPIKNLYKTPETLGKDRLAGVIAANNIFPKSNVLVFDAGTALTVDFINDKSEYLGGSIAPGLKMRFKALNKFTDKLPEADTESDFENIYGNDTINAIRSGVQNGIIYEIEGHINKFSKEYSDLKVTFTGGDTFFFERKIKKQIFAEPNLILIGLNIILKYNAK